MIDKIKASVAALTELASHFWPLQLLRHCLLAQVTWPFWVMLLATLLHLFNN